MNTKFYRTIFALSPFVVTACAGSNLPTHLNDARAEVRAACNADPEQYGYKGGIKGYMDSVGIGARPTPISQHCRKAAKVLVPDPRR